MNRFIVLMMGLLPYFHVQSQDYVKDEESIRKLDLLIEHFVDRSFSGSIYLEKDGELLIHKGYGFANKERKIPFTSETAFSIGTLSQHFLAVSIMILHQEGKIDLEAPITKYLSEVPDDKAKITIHHLLTHQSGLPDFYANKSDHFRIGKGEAVRNILREDLKFRPGNKFSVSNAGYSLLAAILEEIEGRPYLTFLRDEIFGSAGMEHTGFHGDEMWSDEKIARGYGFNERGNNVPMLWPKPGWIIMGNGEIVSSTPDLKNWLDVLESGRILNQETQALMKQKHALDRTNRFIEYGYGWKKRAVHDTYTWYYNGGGEYGQISTLRIYPEANMRLIMVSNSYTDINSVASVLIHQIEKAMLAPDDKS